MSATETVLDIALRAVAAFYVLASFAGLRRVAVDAMLDQAIAAIGGSVDATARAESRTSRLRAISQMILLVSGAVASILAGLMMAAGAFALVAVVALNFLYFGLVAPRWLDPQDPPDPASRRNSWFAGLFHTAFAFATVMHWRNGNMSALTQTHPAILALAGVAIFAVLFQAVRLWRTVQIARASPGSPSPGFMSETEEERLEREAEREAEFAQYDGVSLIFNPAVGESPVLVAGTGERFRGWPSIREFTESDNRMMIDLGWELRESIDPDDPLRQRFRDPDVEAGFRTRVREVFEIVNARLSPGRMSFEPDIRPSPPAIETTDEYQRLDVFASIAQWPVIADGDDNRPIYPDDLGISLRLSEDLSNWTQEYELCCVLEDPEGYRSYGPPRWSDEQRADFEQRGRALAARLAAEFAATGRGGVEVGYRTPEILVA